MNIKEIIDVNKRYDFKLVFDVTDGNPNGDPDAGNLPRVDPETMQGLVTDVAIKRKVRDYIQTTRGDQQGFDIYVKNRGILTNEQRKAYDAIGKEDADGKSSKVVADARDWMCENYFDTRIFGAVMSTKKYNAGQVRGPMQLTFARSIDPVTPFDMTITRVALTNADDGKNNADVRDDETEARHGQMGRKAYLPYGMYETYGFFTPAFAIQTGVREEDLVAFWESLINMWDLDRSASRGRMACRGLYVFAHDSKYGNAPSHQLFEKVDIERKKGENGEQVERVARSYKDYEVKIDEDLPQGVTLHQVVTF